MLAFLKALWSNAKVKAGLALMAGGLVEHFTGFLSSLLSLASGA